MTTTTDQHARTTVIRYLNRGGALVAVDQIDPEPGASAVLVHLADCSGCLWQHADGRLGPIRTAREEAAKHAETCHALPQVGAESASVSSVYLAEAHKLIERARASADRGPAEQQRVRVLVTVAQAMTAFALAAHEIEG